MAIFARLVCMLFAILFCAGVGGALAQANYTPQPGIILCATVGAVVGIFIGRGIGNMVVGKPPKD
jgi:hypothetical protein